MSSTEADAMRPAAAYYRVSSKAQNLASQRAAVERAAKARGDRIARVYQEKASARTLQRPELQRLRVDARAGAVELRRLYVYRLDRLSRSGIRDTFEVIEELRAAGVEVISVGDGFDLNGPASEIVLAVMSWAAKMERVAINERIAAARARVEATGGKWGRPRRAFNVAAARKLRRAGKSLRQVAVALKVPLRTLARRLNEGG